MSSPTSSSPPSHPPSPPLPSSPSSPSSSSSFPLPSLSSFSGYFKRSLPERQTLLLSCLPSLPSYSASALPGLLHSSLSLSSADRMVENCVGLLSLPLGVAPSFVIDGRPYVVPMAVEEPSVVAAASGAGKLIAESGGGFRTSSTGNVMLGQVQLLVADPDAAVRAIAERRAELIRAANALCPSMVKRGGGVVDVWAERRTSRAGKAATAVAFIKVDVCDSMGANAVNTICEGLSSALSAAVEGQQPVRVGLRILSNLCVERRTVSTFRLPLSALAYRGVSGAEVARRVVEAFEFACDDEFRAVTNNKGVMNGMDAVAIATGQDWRAVEAAAHAWAALRHRFDPSYLDAPYGPLATYAVEGEGDSACLVARLEVPISVGTAGGAVSSHPLYKFSLDLLRRPSAAELAAIIVSVGLAQNFAAVRALAVEGIQRGHMALHAKNVAVAAGVDDALVGEVSDWMVASGRVMRSAAQRYSARRKGWAGGRPSTLWVEADGVRVSGVEERVECLVMFDTGEAGPVRLALTKDAKEGEGEEVAVGRRWGGWVGEGAGDVGSAQEAEWEVLRNVLKVVMGEGEGRDGRVSGPLVDAIVTQMDGLRAQLGTAASRPAGEQLLQQFARQRQNGNHAKP